MDANGKSARGEGANHAPTKRKSIPSAVRSADTVGQNDLMILWLYLFLALLSYGLFGGAMFKAREIPLPRA